jgi:hypothetical protein
MWNSVRKDEERCCLPDIAVIDYEPCILQTLQDPGLEHLAGQRQNGVLTL